MIIEEVEFDDGWDALRCHILKQAIKDYTSLRTSSNELEKLELFFDSEWCGLLLGNIDHNTFKRRVKILREEHINDYRKKLRIVENEVFRKYDDKRT